MTISDIKRYREAHDISQLELGRLSRVNHRRICMAERGHITLHEHDVAALLRGLVTALRLRAKRLDADENR